MAREKVYEEDTALMARAAVADLTTPPPLTSGNFPPAPYWVRGEGLIGGQGQLLRRSSQYSNSEERWDYQTYYDGGAAATRASIDETDIPYAPYLGDPNRQFHIHGRNGWKTTDDVIANLEGSNLVKTTLSNGVSRVAEVFGIKLEYKLT